MGDRKERGGETGENVTKTSRVEQGGWRNIKDSERKERKKRKKRGKRKKRKKRKKREKREKRKIRIK